MFSAAECKPDPCRAVLVPDSNRKATPCMGCNSPGRVCH
jgi:hypothetical protein